VSNLKKVHFQHSQMFLSTKLAFRMRDGSIHRTTIDDGLADVDLAKQFIKFGFDMLERIKQRDKDDENEKDRSQSI